MKKTVSVFIIGCFLSNIFFLNALAAGNSLKSVLAGNTPLSGLNANLTLRQQQDLIHNVDVLLDMINSMDFADDPEAAAVIEQVLGDSALPFPGEKFYDVINRHLPDFLARDPIDIAPGCFSNIFFAFTGIYAVTPFILYLFLQAAIVEDSLACTTGWGLLGIASVAFGLNSWIDYRICAEENSESPDQNTLDLLQEDKEFLQQTAWVGLTLGLIFATDCNRVFRSGSEGIFGSLRD